MKLLIDVGNSRLKWALADAANRLIESGALPHNGNPAAALAQASVPHSPQSICIASVAGAAASPDLSAACQSHWQCSPKFVKTGLEQDGLKNAYAQPTRLGVDRWLAMLAAWTSTKGACLVADLGTALTVDAIDESGQHLGGIIAAGLLTSEKAVLGATQFNAREPGGLLASDGLGTDTESCVRQGAVLSCLGAIDRVGARIPGARAFLTGGDAEQLAPFLEARWQVRPQLVLEGILIAARSA